jgi:hypothetical protein
VGLQDVKRAPCILSGFKVLAKLLVQSFVETYGGSYGIGLSYARDMIKHPSIKT